MFELQKPEITLFCKTLFTEKACADGCTFHYRMLADGERLIRLPSPLDQYWNVLSYCCVHPGIKISNNQTTVIFFSNYF